MSMADYRATFGVGGPRPRFFDLLGETEPVLDLIKQVEQVTILVLERPASRLAATPSQGITDAVEVLVFLIWQSLGLAVIWLQKQPGAAEGDRFAKGQSGNATGPTRRFQEPGHIGCRAVALPSLVRLIHNCEKKSKLRPARAESAERDAAGRIRKYQGRGR